MAWSSVDAAASTAEELSVEEEDEEEESVEEEVSEVGAAGAAGAAVPSFVLPFASCLTSVLVSGLAEAADETDRERPNDRDRG